MKKQTKTIKIDFDLTDELDLKSYESFSQKVEKIGHVSKKNKFKIADLAKSALSLLDDNALRKFLKENLSKRDLLSISASNYNEKHQTNIDIDTFALDIFPELSKEERNQLGEITLN